MDIKELSPVERELIKQGLANRVAFFTKLASGARAEGRHWSADDFEDTANTARKLRDRVEAIQWGTGT